jgi:hypothetical protein
MLLEHAYSGSGLSDEINRIAEMETAHLRLPEEIREKQQRVIQRAMTEECRTDMWYILTENPCDYLEVLEDDILPLLYAARSEADFIRGVKRAFFTKPWVHWRQFEWDMRYFYPDFDQHREDQLFGSYKYAILLLMEQLRQDSDLGIGENL